ncbi:hypothetical protein A7J57_21190 [Agrobacterium tumefaciens]|uniref:Uncharacterized protein n=1 Tax=Agrobacterium tumefaciens TaxID=358 RepID=A0A176XHX7_AGRTU|nr:hypothetical protein A7J57_21190 [Agrobacterium tumefaciens]
MREEGVRHIAKQKADGKEKSAAAPGLQSADTVRTQMSRGFQTFATGRRNAATAFAQEGKNSVTER